MTSTIDHQRIVEEIQSDLAYDAVMPDITVDALAADYAVVCEDANQRLRECADLLRRGLRGEAIQRCEIEPNLLDVVAVLDFPERAGWCDLLRQSGRAVPPALLMDAAAELNAAYAVDQPLTALMKRHRLLALARAPLRDRITIVREITSADPANPLWGDDLRAYERHRHKQLQAEIDAAARTGDVSCLATLEHELRESVWAEPPPALLLERVAGQATRLRAQQARAELAQIEPELNAAFSDFDVQRARPLRGRWKACQMLAALAEGDPLNEMVAPALDWLDEQDRRDQAEAEHAQALVDLERALDEEHSRHDLDRLYHRLLSCDRGMPQLLKRRFDQRMAELATGESRRNKLRFAAVGAAAIVTAASILLFIGHRTREHEVAEAVKSLHALLEESKVGEAQHYFDMIRREKPWLNQRPEIEEQHARLDGMVQAENDRLAAFASAMSGAQAAGLDLPDRALVDQARRLATTSGEQADLHEFERRIAARQRELQDEKNEVFTTRVEEIRQRMEQLDADYPDDIERRLAATTQLGREAADLVLGDAGGAEPALVHNARALHTRLLALAETANLQLDQKRYLQDISGAVANRPRFRSRLADYIKRFPGSKRSADFQKVLDADTSLDDELAKWNALTARFASIDIGHITPDEASARIAEASTLLNEWRADPQAELIRARVAALEPIARRIAGGTRIDAQLKELFGLPTMAELKAIKTKGNATYYYDPSFDKVDEVGKDKKVVVRYVKDFKLGRDTVFLKSDEVVARDVDAPQSVVGLAVLKELQGLTDGHWEVAFCRMLEVVDKNAELDPILKAQLLLQVLSVARTGSLVLEHAFAKQFELLSDSAPDGTVNWLDPDDKRAAKARKAAADLLRGLPDLHAAREAAAKEYAALRKPWSPAHYRWIGWLVEREDGKWQCASQPLAEDWSADLVTLSQSAEPPVTEILSIGRLEKGHAIVNCEPSALMEGRPVYAALVEHTKQDKAN